MATAENAKVQIETGQTVNDYAVMTDSGDNQIFTISGGTVWSGRSGYTPDVRPNGIKSGRNLLTTHADDDKVTIAGFTAYIEGTLYTVTATTATFSRPATASKAKVYSFCLASDGATIEVEAGTISATTAFSETRDAAGGPPLIPIKSVELGQVRVTASTSAAVTSDEIFQVVGTHTERWDYPNWDEYNLGNGENADTSAEQNAHIKFNSALPDIHTGSLLKRVFIKYYAPIFSKVQRAIDFVPAETTHSISSEDYYGGVNFYANAK